MARIRSLKPEFWDDRKLARLLSRDARMLYMGIWCQADEWSRCNGDPEWLKGRIFPFDDDLTASVVEQLLSQLAQAGRIYPYEHEGDPYLYLPYLAKHQRLEPHRAKSRLPDPPWPDGRGPNGAPIDITTTVSSPSEPDADMSASDAHQSTPSTDTSESDASSHTLLYGMGCMGHGSWVMGHGVGVPGTDEPASGTPQRRATHAPDNLLVTEAMRTWAAAHDIRVDIDRETERFLDHHRARGNSFKDWQAAWRNWMNKAEEYRVRDTGKSHTGGGYQPYQNPPDEAYHQGWQQ